MKVRVCDICQKNCPKVKIKYKCKAKRFWMLALNSYGWARIDICQDCLDKIIKAKEEAENVSSTL